MEDFSRLERKMGEAVGADFEGAVGAEILDLDLLIGSEDDGPVGDRVGANGRDHDGVEDGAKDRTPGSEGVGCRPVRSGDDDPIGFKSIEVGSINVNGDFNEARVLSAMNHDIVDGKAMISLSVSALKGEAVFDVVGAAKKVFEAGIDFVEGNIGHESEMSHVDAEDGGI